MKLFIIYLKSKLKAAALFLIFAAVFTVSFLLCHIPIVAVLYPLGICIFIGCIFIIIDFMQTKKNHGKIKLLEKFSAEINDFSAPAQTVCEKDYRQAVKVLKSEIEKIKAEDFSKYRDMTEYYTVWVHQIKTPISSMKLSLQSEDTAFSRLLSSELMHIEQYVEMVLTFLRLSSKSSDYIFKKYDIDALIRASLRKFAPEFILRKLSLDYTPINIEAVTDEKWFAFVIEQLISNALKYTKSGNITIRQSGENSLTISDTGIGIASEDLPRIFEKGYTGYNGRSDKSASGLGLYLCKTICDNLNIDISITSEVGKGSRVRLKFPKDSFKFE